VGEVAIAIFPRDAPAKTPCGNEERVTRRLCNRYGTETGFRRGIRLTLFKRFLIPARFELD
jgi:hypothetical protein